MKNRRSSGCLPLTLYIQLRMAAPVLFQHRKQIMWIDVGTDAAYLKFLLQFCDGGRARVFDRDQLTLLSAFC